MELCNSFNSLPLFCHKPYKGKLMATGETPEFYHQRATEMWAQVARAETGYLKGVYSAIAENWEKLAAQMEAGTLLAQQAQHNSQDTKQ